MSSPKEIAEYIIKDGIITTNAEDVYSIARAYLELENKYDKLLSITSESLDIDTAHTILSLDEEIEKIKSENISLKIDYQALENSNRKLNEANARIVEFEDIKKSHLATIEKLKKSRDGLRKAFEVIARGESQFDNVDHMYTAREAIKADDEIMGDKK